MRERELHPAPVVVIAALASAGLLPFANAARPAAGLEPSATAYRLVALTDDNTLVRFRSDRPAEAQAVKVTKVSGTLVGLDRRPANGQLYAVTATSDLYTIDPATGAGRAVGTLTVAFDGGARSGFDFNPQSDRLRLVGGQGQNLRVHPDLGAAASDGSIAYARGDRHFGKKAVVAGVAYTRSVKGATSTKTFDLDAAQDVLALQEPPNDGRLTTVGPLGADFDALAGFDIFTEPSGREVAFAVSGGVLYAIDLETGKAAPLGALGAGTRVLVGLTILGPVPPGP